MLAYLDAENAYADAVLAPTKPLQEKLYGEIVGRIKQDDSSVPYRERGYWYYTRFETGKDYPIHARRKGTMDGAGGSAARRQRDGRGQGLSSMSASGRSARTTGCWPGRKTTVGRRQYMVHFKQPGDRRSLSPTRSPAWRPEHGLGRRQQDPVLCRERSGNPAARCGSKSTCSARRSPTTRWSTRRRTTASTWASSRTRDDKFICIDAGQHMSPARPRCAPAADPRDVHGAGAAPARRRIQRRPPRRPLGDPHQLPMARRTSS